MENWVETTRETVSKFLCLESLSTRFHELKEVLQTARCAVILEKDALGRLDRDIDQVFYDACDLAFESRDLMQLFESKCERALSNVDTIMLHLKDGQIKHAANRLRSLHQMSLTMQEKSVEMVKKFRSFSKNILEIARWMCEQKNVDKKRLDNLLQEIDLQLMRSKMELNELTETKEQAKKAKELQEKKMAMALHKSSMENVLSWFSSLTVKITSYFKMKVEVQCPDTKVEIRLRQSEEAFEEASKKQQDSAQDVIQQITKRRKVVKERSNTEILVRCMEKTVRLMDNLKVSVLETSSFWRHLQNCCSTVAEDTELVLDKIETCTENTSCLDHPGVEDSMQKFNALWKLLKEVCTESKEELKKVAEALKSAYTEILSPEEAMSYVLTNLH